MDYKDLEDELKREAEEIKTTDFSEHWSKVQPHVQAQGKAQEQLVAEPVAATGNGSLSNRKNLSQKVMFVCGVFLLLCVIILAIVLPITLRNRNSSISPPTTDTDDRENHYLQSTGLTCRLPEKEEFYRELDAAKISVLDFSAYEVEIYTLWVTEANEVKGGGVYYFDEENESDVTLDFYGKDIEVSPQRPLFFSECTTETVNGITVKYVIERGEEAYTVWALAEYRDCGFWFEILSANENIFAVIETLFK